ncbi:hypothetical protein SAMN05216360_109252 [Methylobacterium phyllostachyos]|uniref:UrcA family protein n=1 Tax=Methylobacterium phyllostachyos TaxID=582672 RepID=A0A1H0CQS5_9HYPH|nr:hypothetical protein [Methylobacterium phyllostachyos]SDN60186.1 hypothetical protein SAMN05216360_109252 [Methylobacterium phyllostachyos]
MPQARLVSTTPFLMAVLLVANACPARADGEAAMRHAVWRDCLARNFRVQVTLTARDLAADAAFRACRDPEAAYLAALTGSPLLDDEDVARARPLLAGRNRTWLISNPG